jgi:hypothetical protein
MSLLLLGKQVVRYFVVYNRTDRSKYNRDSADEIVHEISPKFRGNPWVPVPKRGCEFSALFLLLKNAL